jgi:hypothetical protein
MSKIWLMTAMAVASLAEAPAQAKPMPLGCPQPVVDAIARSVPSSTITACKAAREHDRNLFEVKVTKADHGKLEIDVAPDGAILLIEEQVAVDQVPAAVMKAFAAKYPRSKVVDAEKQTPTGGTPRYELAFTTASGRKEATFTQDGAFVGEE